MKVNALAVSMNLTALLSLATTVAVCAQTSNAQAQGGGIDEIIVTAERRESSLQEVPMSISVLTSDMLERSGIDSTVSLQIAVPSLTFSSAGVYGQPFIRGIGSDVAAPNAESSIAVYIDGVYQAASFASLFDLVEVERVEVLKGPQGTLYGRNAVGGAISVITLTPQQELEGRVAAGYGNYGNLQTSGFISGGVSEDLALGIYVNHSSRDTYDENISPLKPETDEKVTSSSIRAKAVYTPGERLKFTFTADYTDMEDDGVFYLRQVQPNSVGAALGGQSSSKPHKVRLDDPSFGESDNFGLALRAEADLDFATLVSITGYRDITSDARIDFDGTDAPVVGFSNAPFFSKQLSQEIQLLSNDSSTLKWIAGLYYFDEASGADPLRIFTPIVGPASGDAAETQVFNKVDTTSYAAFGQITVPVTERFSVTGGLRYTDDEKKFHSGSVSLLGVPGSPQPVVIPWPDDKRSWDEITWSGRLEYQADSALIYGSINRGFKSGAFNTTSPFSPPVEPEILDAYEIGMKSDFYDNRLRLNIAAFYNDIEDLQVQIVGVNSGGAPLWQNSGKAIVKGIEIETIAQLTDALQISASLMASDSEYKEFVNFSGFVPSSSGVGYDNVSLDVSGNKVQRIPDFSGTFSVLYSFTIGQLGRFELVGTWYHNDGYYFDPAQQTSQSSFDLFGGSLSWFTQDERLKLSLWGQNLGDEEYFEFNQISNFGENVYDAPPRTYGVRLVYTL